MSIGHPSMVKSMRMFLLHQLLFFMLKGTLIDGGSWSYIAINVKDKWVFGWLLIKIHCRTHLMTAKIEKPNSHFGNLFCLMIRA